MQLFSFERRQWESGFPTEAACTSKADCFCAIVDQDCIPSYGLSEPQNAGFDAIYYIFTVWPLDKLGEVLCQQPQPQSGSLGFKTLDKPNVIEEKPSPGLKPKGL